MERKEIRLNPAAPEFNPGKKVLNYGCPIITQPNYPPFSCYPDPPYSFFPSAVTDPLSQFPFPYIPYYPPYQPAAAILPAVSPLLEPACKPIEMAVPEEPKEPRVAPTPNEAIGGIRRSNKHHKPSRRSKRFVKEAIVRADHCFSQAVPMKEWKPKVKLSSNESAKEDNKQFAERNANNQPLLEYCSKKVKAVRVVNRNREKHPPIPLKNGGKETTVMIRNIPNRYTREMFKDFLDQHCMLMNKEEESGSLGAADEEPSLSAFDFLYLPIDFSTKSNKGYAFVNFTTPEAARKLYNACHNKHWTCFQSKKICEIYCAKLQGTEQLSKHFERMEFPSKDFQPVIFNPSRDGSKQLVEETIVGRCIDGL